MGWLYMQSLKGHPGPRQYLDTQFTFERPEARLRVLRSALVKMRTWYAAVEILRPDREREVAALVCLVRYNPRDREGYIFGYKDMDETVGPYEAECPVAILDLLTPTENANALAWRAKCRAHAAAKSTRPKLRAGQVVVFDAPLRFSDGACLDRLEVVIDPRRPRAVRFRAPGGCGLYRIGAMARRSFRIESGPPMSGPQAGPASGALFDDREDAAPAG